MQDFFIKFLTIFGSLGLFLYGMKLMSQALQKVSGVRMRAILAAITANRFKSVISGLFITGIIQSSSASTVLIVSFVNAGMLSLVESIGLIMGANIGTTLTAWIISVFGFHFKIYALALPLIGLSFPLLFTGRERHKYWAEFIIGFALIFLGLDFLQNAIPDFGENQHLLDVLGKVTHHGFFSILLFLFLGIVITSIFQSSSVSMALTIVLCHKGLINFDLAAAMTLGINIGTTMTANLAAIVANTAAKVAARSHLMFNVIGVIWALLTFPLFMRMIDQIVLVFTESSPHSDIEMVPIGLSLFHTVFNLANTLLLVWFVPGLLKLSSKLVPHDAENKEIFRLKYLSTGILSTSELSLIQARKEISVYARRSKMMFRLVKSLFNETNEESFHQIHERVQNYKGISDRMEQEITQYLTRSTEGELSIKSFEKVRTMLGIVDSIRHVADTSYNIARSLNQKKKEKIWFTQDIRNNLNKMFDLIEEAILVMQENVSMEPEQVSMEKAKKIEKAINSLRNKLKKENLDNTEQKNYKYQAGVFYSEIFSQCERLGDHVFKVTEIICSAPPKKEGNRVFLF